MAQTTQADNGNSQSARLYMAIELAKKNWKLGFGDGDRQRIRTVPGRDLLALASEIELAKKKLKLPEQVEVVSCYEAGCDGFSVHRALERLGVSNCVVDPGSIERPSRKHAKTDRLDAKMLLRKLIRHHQGDKVWSVVRVPTPEAEDARASHRERQQLVKERGAHVTRIKSLLFTQGIVLERFNQLGKVLDELDIGVHLKARIRRELARLSFLQEQIDTLEAEQKKQLETEQSQPAAKMRRLHELKGVGPVCSRALVVELFGWRHFNNRRELAGCVGLTGTPSNSGESEREQGISKTGQPALRALLVELSWGWLRYQPDSALTRWFFERFGKGKRHRKIGIIALARKLLIALWRYVEQGVVPKGARMSQLEAK